MVFFSFLQSADLNLMTERWSRLSTHHFLRDALPKNKLHERKREKNRRERDLSFSGMSCGRTPLCSRGGDTMPQGESGFPWYPHGCRNNLATVSSAPAAHVTKQLPAVHQLSLCLRKWPQGKVSPRSHLPSVLRVTSTVTGGDPVSGTRSQRCYLASPTMSSCPWDQHTCAAVTEGLVVWAMQRVHGDPENPSAGETESCLD